MDNFKIIYRILKILERAMDSSEFDEVLISAKVLGISHERGQHILWMLLNNGYIEGLKTVRADGVGVIYVSASNVSITLKGLEYLEENGMMKKVAAIAKGVIDVVK